MNKYKIKLLVIFFLSLVLSSALSFFIGKNFTNPQDITTSDPAKSASPAEEIIWTCSMHPQFKLKDKVPCPICGMELIPLKKGESLGEWEIRLSAYAEKLAEIELKPAERKLITRYIQLPGKINFDETQIKQVSARFSGRLDRLFVDYTGINVKKGDHLFKIYSPELIIAQKELIQAKNYTENLKDSSSDIIKTSSKLTVQAARDKLRLWGMDDKQIEKIEASSKVLEHMEKYSPISGVVIKKHLDEGAYVKEGDPVYSIANLQSLWVELEAYEADLPWLHFAQKVDFEIESYPGETFSGLINFIHPVLNPKTRTVKIRLNVKNEDGRLKPAMFVRASIKVNIGKDGHINNQLLKGKWISPMHPEVISDKPGNCTVCGMDLVPAAELGLIKNTETELPLVIPTSAVLLTGKRAVVYVKNKDHIYEGRVVTLGERSETEFIVKDGLEEGELIVVNGNFKIDSALQIMAKPSMMSETSIDTPVVFNLSSEFRKSFAPMQNTYLKLSTDLSKDNYSTIKQIRNEFENALKRIDTSSLNGTALTTWDNLTKQIHIKIKYLSNSEDLETARVRFEPLSKLMIRFTEQFGSSDTIHLAYCPMAFNDKGAKWLQNEEDVANPYFGSGMYRCGDIQKTFGPNKKLKSTENYKRETEKIAITETSNDPSDVALRAYLRIQKNLSLDKKPSAKDAGIILDQLKEMNVDNKVLATLNHMHHKDIEDARKDFETLSKIMIPLAKKGTFSQTVREAYCSMAFNDQGASWLQTEERVENPYWGSRMYRCGGILEVYKGGK
ncbi:efflux RND transporter periplasmic adaptor subunit [Lentisphaera marina]|uniref:efflux RND transporter periplasmic adaptor subunit n=1 Tax=Lentisphaera marina TaxID=1111041 RepID=UPI0023663F88|nr:efflux RND transporter periplasmic adaptor subunit [Lentisphaera marina]MDD7984140.1 efflux RND transporter periplasmic adaptor subunit [Lentisphaera marina]